MKSSSSQGGGGGRGAEMGENNGGPPFIQDDMGMGDGGRERPLSSWLRLEEVKEKTGGKRGIQEGGGGRKRLRRAREGGRETPRCEDSKVSYPTKQQVRSNYAVWPRGIAPGGFQWDQKQRRELEGEKQIHRLAQKKTHCGQPDLCPRKEGAPRAEKNTFECLKVKNAWKEAFLIVWTPN